MCILLLPSRFLDRANLISLPFYFKQPLAFALSHSDVCALLILFVTFPNPLFMLNPFSSLIVCSITLSFHFHDCGVSFCMLNLVLSAFLRLSSQSLDLVHLISLPLTMRQALGLSSRSINMVRLISLPIYIGRFPSMLPLSFICTSNSFHSALFSL